MLITGRTLFAFVDPKDPFMAAEVAGEEQPGPILSMMAARPFDHLFLFYTPHVRANAESTRAEVNERYPKCVVATHELAVSDPKDYSRLMGSLAREVRRIARMAPDADHSVCVSSGTAEMRAAWFLLTAVGVLPAKLLQVGSPAYPLFGAANVKEVRFDAGEWGGLRDLIMPQEYFGVPTLVDAAVASTQEPQVLLQAGEGRRVRMTQPVPFIPQPRFPELDSVLEELGIVACSAVLRTAAENAAIAAGSDAPVLLLGETGTGKELFAKLIHRMSERRQKPMVPVNCAGIPKDLAESLLFGHLKGSFTGATKDQVGWFQHADGGTLFLDELAELTPEVQAKLLKVVEDFQVLRLGAKKPQKVDVRIIAATNHDLDRAVAEGRFRKDLYYRLKVFPILLPPLRNRHTEIGRLALALLKRVNQRYKRQRQLSKEAIVRLERHSWPGNVRELAGVIERSVFYANGDILGPDDLKIEESRSDVALLPEPAPGFCLQDFLKDTRKQLIDRALALTNRNQKAAADLLGMKKQSISKFLQEQPDKRR